MFLSLFIQAFYDIIILGDVMTTGEKIRLYRKKAGLTQQQLASKLGFPYQRIGQYENGYRNPRNGVLIKIAEALNVEPSELISDISDEIAAQIEKRKLMEIKIESILEGSPMSEGRKAEVIERLNRNITFQNEYDSLVAEIQDEYDKHSIEVLEKIDTYIRRLNISGQDIAVERVQELTEIKKYQKDQ